MGEVRLYRRLPQRASILNVKILFLIKENQIFQIKEFSTFLYMGRNKSWYAPQMCVSGLGPVACIFTSWVFTGLTVVSGCSLVAVDGKYSFLHEFFWAHLLTLEGCKHWLLWHPLFTDMKGSISFVIGIVFSFLSSLHSPKYWGQIVRIYTIS